MINKNNEKSIFRDDLRVWVVVPICHPVNCPSFLCSRGEKLSRLLKKTNFTIVSNAVIYDKKISFKAKGVYLYLCSRPDGWDFKMAEIASNGTDGMDSLRSALKELEESGYLKRHRVNLPNGKFTYDYEIFETPSGSYEEPYRYFPHTVETVTEKLGSSINTELRINTELKEKEENHDTLLAYLDEWKKQFGTNPIVTGSMRKQAKLRLVGVSIVAIRETVKKYANALRDDKSWITVRVDGFEFLTSGKFGFEWFLNATPERLKSGNRKKSDAENKPRGFFDATPESLKVGNHKIGNSEDKRSGR